MTYTFQLLTALLTTYTYGYTHNSFYVHTSTHLYTYISTMHAYVHQSCEGTLNSMVP